MQKPYALQSIYRSHVCCETPLVTFQKDVGWVEPLDLPPRVRCVLTGPTREWLDSVKQLWPKHGRRQAKTVRKRKALQKIRSENHAYAYAPYLLDHG